MNIDVQGYRQNDNRNESVEKVWHTLCLENTAKLPWTTAPAFTSHGFKPPAQDTLKYTPPGARINLKLTVSNPVLILIHRNKENQ